VHSAVDGRTFLHNAAAPAHQQPLAALFRRHFRMCVYANMRPEPYTFDHEVDMGSGGFDLSNEFWSSPEGHMQLDMELRSRLYALEDRKDTECVDDQEQESEGRET
jgi:hypothetical protein